MCCSPSNVTKIRARVSSVFLIASMLMLTSGSLFALPRHEVCEAMRHACDKADDAISCCCGDRSESNPSQTPTRGTDGPSIPNVAVLGSTPVPALAPDVVLVHLNAPPLTRPPDLQILFSDLRL